jgi:hypothetical protein
MLETEKVFEISVTFSKLTRQIAQNFIEILMSENVYILYESRINQRSTFMLGQILTKRNTERNKFSKLEPELKIGNDKNK